MRQIYLVCILFASFLSSCEKCDFMGTEECPIEVSVKVVDALCSNLILEIQDDSRKCIGDMNFEYKGLIYKGAILINRAECVSTDFIKSMNDENSINNRKVFKVRLSKKAPSNSCDKGTCTATFYKVPTKVFYISN